MEREIKTAVVTGPTGAVGMALLKILRDNRVKTYAVVRPDSPRKKQIQEDEYISIVECDLSNIAFLHEIIQERIDSFFHLGWSNTIGDGRNDMPSQIKNIEYAVGAVNVADKLGCKVFIGTGSQAEYGRVEGILTGDTPCFPENGYGIAKLCAGQMTRLEAKKYGIDHIWTRILSVYGPYDGPKTLISSLIEALNNGDYPRLTEGIQKWDYLYSEDAANALFLLSQKGINNKTYVISGGQSRPLKEYIEIVKNEIRPEIDLKYGEIPYSENQVMMLEGDIKPLILDTGFSPKVDFREGIKRTLSSKNNC